MKDERINHRGSCDGNLECPRCHRRMCVRCVTNDAEYEKSHKTGHKGECLICSKMFTEDKIVLWPAPMAGPGSFSRRYNKLYPEGVYRLVRIGEEDE